MAKDKDKMEVAVDRGRQTGMTAGTGWKGWLLKERDIFLKHRIVFILLGLRLPGDLGGYPSLKLALQVWHYYMTLMFSVLCIGFLFGVIIDHGEYVITAILYSMLGVLSCSCVFTKYLTVYHHRHDVADLIAFLRDVKADTTLGKFTYCLSIFYEGMAVCMRFMILLKIAQHGKWQLVMPFWTPYSKKEPIVMVATAVFVQCSAAIKTFTNFFIDTLFLLMANQLCHKFLILKSSFELVGLSEGEKRSRLASRRCLRFPDLADESIFRSCVIEHVRLIKAVEKFERIINLLYLPQVLNAFLTLCIVLLSCSQSKNLYKEVVHCIPMTNTAFLQLFVSCFSGELIRARYNDILDASYSNGWYDTSERLKSSILITQTYATRPKVLRGAYVFELSLHTFETAVKEIFSTFTVMYQLFNTT